MPLRQQVSRGRFGGMAADGVMVVIGVVGMFVMGMAAEWWILRGAEKAWRREGERAMVERDIALENHRQAVRRIGELERVTVVAEQPAGDPPWVREMLTRLLDAALPAKETLAEEDKPETPAEYEPPWEPVPDWTDAAFG